MYFIPFTIVFQEKTYDQLCFWHLYHIIPFSQKMCILFTIWTHFYVIIKIVK